MAKALSFDLNYYGFDSLAPDMLNTFFDQFYVIELITARFLYGDFVVIFTNSSMMVIYGIFAIWLLFKGGELIPHR